jgi:hypothetical protein
MERGLGEWAEPGAAALAERPTVMPGAPQVLAAAGQGKEDHP